MTFDITTIDKKKLLKALYKYSVPIGCGTAEYEWMASKGKNVELLSDDDCENALKEFNIHENEYYRLFDYHNGKPLKIDFCNKKNGRVIANSNGYDSRNGIFSFLIVIINTFGMEEVKIINKSYTSYENSEMKMYDRPTKEEIVYYRNLIKTSIQKENHFGKFWQLK